MNLFTKSNRTLKRTIKPKNTSRTSFKTVLEKQKIPISLRQKISNIASSTVYNVLMSIITIYTIFAMDIDKGFCNAGASIIFSSIHIVTMVLFIAQIIMLCQVSFVVYLDKVKLSIQFLLLD